MDEIESLREIQALRRLNLHPNIIQLEEVIFDAKYGLLSLSFELMDYNLYDVLSKKGMPPVNETRAKWIMWQVTKALDFVHGKGVFHRDIKPENILVRGDVHAVPMPFPSSDPKSHYNSTSSFPLVKLADFGSCRGIHSRMPYTEYIATRWYRSPECLLFDGIYSYKMDIWGIGCVLYEIVTKLPLFPGENELDQLHKVHKVFGTPSERLLNVMVAVGTQNLMVAPDGKANPKAAGKLAKGIWKQKFSFTPDKGSGLRTAFPQHILCGAHKAALPKNCNHNPAEYPGLSDACINLLELLLQYDPEARPSARQALKHPWLKECRDAELSEKQLETSMRDLSVPKQQQQQDTQKSLSISPSKLFNANDSDGMKSKRQSVHDDEKLNADMAKLAIKSKLPVQAQQQPQQPTKKPTVNVAAKTNTHRKSLGDDDKQYKVESTTTTNHTLKNQPTVTAAQQNELSINNSIREDAKLQVAQ